MQLEYSKMLMWFHHNHPEEIGRFIQSVSPNQIECKNWLVDSLDNVVIPRDELDNFKIEIVGGWFGLPLIELLNKKYRNRIKGIDFFEIDPFACKVLGRYIRFFGGSLPPINIFNQDYFEYEEERRTHLIINTSCEHMQDMSVTKECYISPERTLLVLQSNDKRDELDHINCVENGQELAYKSDIKELYGDYKKFYTDKKKWHRYMIMGKWLG